ncbi:MAG: MFS transporter [Acidobacteria bacterium]|nr:MFS transporter [Acidobacteriota bacterium]
MSFSERLQEIRSGFERPFWVANVTELFERLSYYAAFASLARYLNETLQFPVQQASSLAGWFGGAVWFLAAFGGAVADRMGFRRALSLAYLILSIAYFLLGSIAAPWLAPVRNAMPLGALLGFILFLPALGIALVKPAVVGTTGRSSAENVRSIGYSFYYTLVNIGGAAGPLVASWVHKHLSVENVFRVAALAVFAMFFAVLLLFREPQSDAAAKATSLGHTARNFLTVITNPRFMLFLLIFSGYWVVYWQEFITLPLYVTRFVDPHADTERLLATGPVVVIALTVAINLVTRKIPSLAAVALGTLISALAWILLVVHPTVPFVVLTLVGVALGEITLSPRYYEYISRLAPAGQQGTYMGFAFLPIGIGSFIAGPVGGWLLHRYGETAHRPAMIWWAVAGIGVATALLLFLYDRLFSVTPGSRAPELARTEQGGVEN